ncbi:MAG: DUF4159 domain-containing protein [Bdellovibrionales bacterium]
MKCLYFAVLFLAGFSNFSMGQPLSSLEMIKIGPSQQQNPFEDFVSVELSRPDYEDVSTLIPSDFTWLRIKYETGTYSWEESWWDTDYPAADQNFLRGVGRYTNIDARPSNHISLELMDEKLFEYSFLYFNFKSLPLEAQWNGPEFTEEEALTLREFALRGGLILMDDLWSENHFRSFLNEYIKIFPDRELVKLDPLASPSPEIFHMFYDIDEVLQVPGGGVTWQNGESFILDDPRYPPALYGVYDDDGRIMLLLSYNSDLGDGWEHTFFKKFPSKYSNYAYKLGINILIYAATH